MNLNFGLSLGGLFRPTAAPTQAQVNQNIALHGNAINKTAQDSVVKKSQKREAMKLVSADRGTRKVLDASGITKPAPKKKA